MEVNCEFWHIKRSVWIDFAVVVNGGGFLQGNNLADVFKLLQTKATQRHKDGECFHEAPGGFWTSSRWTRRSSPPKAFKVPGRIVGSMQRNARASVITVVYSKMRGRQAAVTHKTCALKSEFNVKLFQHNQHFLWWFDFKAGEKKRGCSPVCRLPRQSLDSHME